MWRCPIKDKQSWTWRESSVCFLNITKTWRNMGSFARNEENHQKSGCGVFWRQNTIENCPSGRIGNAYAAKVKVFPKSIVEEVDTNGNASKPNEVPDKENKAEANVLPTKSTHRGKHQNLTPEKKNASKPTLTLQHGNETMGNSRYPDMVRKSFGKW